MSKQLITIDYHDAVGGRRQFTCLVEKGAAFTLPELDNTSQECTLATHPSSHPEMMRTQHDEALGLAGTYLIVFGLVGLGILATLSAIGCAIYLGYQKYLTNKQKRASVTLPSTNITDHKIKL